MTKCVCRLRYAKWLAGPGADESKVGQEHSRVLKIYGHNKDCEMIANALKALKLSNYEKTDYEKAFDLGLPQISRWEEGVPHHHMSIRLMKFLQESDYKDYEDHFGWKVGGDGDNGETLMYQMDVFFELQDKEKPCQGTMSS